LVNKYGVESFYNQGTLVNRGSLGRTSSTFNIDVGTKYVMKLDDSALTFRADVFNLLVSYTVIEIDEVADEESGVPYTTYGLATHFQAPRTVRLAVT